MRRRELFGDLKAGVAATDHEDRPVRHVLGPPVADRVRLEEIRPELLGQLRYVGRLERPGRDDDLIRRYQPPVDCEAETPVVAALELLDLAVQLHRKLVGRGIALEVGDHLVAGRVAVGVAGERQAWQRAVATRGEEGQRLPALAPSGSDLAGALEDQELPSLALEEMADRQAGLSGTDDHDSGVVGGLGRHAGIRPGLAHLCILVPGFALAKPLVK